MTSMTDTARGVVLDGRYRIEEVIGVGGMASVYRATDQLLSRDVALKLFPPTPVEDERARQQAEISVLAGLNHPGLVTLLDAGACFAGGPAPQTYIVMELVAGPTLADLLRAGPLTARATAVIGRQLAEALAAVHEGLVVHRDVKPANVLFVEPLGDDAVAARIKLADFGIARVLDAARLTVTGLTMGTATYLSPEQAAGGAVGTATDVYSLGLVLLECLTGEKAFTGSVVEVAAARLTTSPAIPTGLGPAWAGLLTGMTRRDPHERLGLGEVARRLDDLAANDAVPATERTMVLEAALVPGVTGPGVSAPGTSGPGVDQDGAPGGASGPVPSGRSRPELPSLSRRGRALRRGWRLVVGRETPGRTLWLGAALAVVLLAVLLVLVRPDVGNGSGVAVPTRPDVPGPLGTALTVLVESVQP